MVLVYYFKLFIILLATEKGSAKQNILPEATHPVNGRAAISKSLLVS